MGALQALFERGIVPDILVGTSAGKEALYPSNRLTILWRIITRRDTLFPNANFLRFI